MPFSVPSLKRIVRRIQYDVEGVLDNGASFLRWTVEYAFSAALGAATLGLHKHIRWGVRQLFVDSADEEFIDRIARIWLGENARIDATKASFTITVTGLADILVPAGTVWQRDDGTEYESLAGVNTGPDPFQVELTVRAVEAGQAGNIAPGTILSLVSPVAQLESTATVTADPGLEEVGSGTDRETDDELVVRVLERIQSPPSGGGPGDYVRWAKEVAGVTRAWEFGQYAGPGTVAVFFVRDNDADLIPDAAEVAAVQSNVDDNAPIATTVTVYAPSELPLNPSIQLSPNTPEVQAQVTAQLEELLLRRAEPGGTLPFSQLSESVSLAQDEEDHVFVSPTADVVPAQGQLITLGTPVYSAIP